MSCAHVDEIEELALELLTDVEEERARAHLASCHDCRAAHERLVEERALFQRRAEVMSPALSPPPYLAAAVLESIEPPSVRGRIASASRALIAIAACVAAFTTTGWIDRASTNECPPHARADEPTTEPGASWLSVATNATFADNRSPRSSIEEPLACALPVSGVVRANRSDDGLACVVVDRATCEERVTSSIATP
jgi:predicted anti-sigma-YlaC factor YlaD